MFAYIILTHARTLPSMLVRLWTGDEYTHAAISLDSPLHMYSFGRKHKYNFLNGGFIEEYLDPRSSGDLRVLILRIPVTAGQHRAASVMIRRFKQHQKEYHYNFPGIAGYMLHKNINRKRAYFCSQFVAMLLEKSGICRMEQPCCFIRPMDFLRVQQKEIVFQGRLDEYAITEKMPLIAD